MENHLMRTLGASILTRFVVKKIARPYNPDKQQSDPFSKAVVWLV